MMRSQLRHDVGAMDFYRASGSVKLGRDFTVGHALEHEVQHRLFDFGQGFRRLSAARLAQSPIHGREQLALVRRTLEAIRRAGLHGLDGRIDPPGSHQHDDGQPGRDPPDAGQQFKSLDRRLRDVGDQKPAPAVADGSEAK
jgi:hypothetical protein